MLEEVMQKYNLPPVPACKIYHADMQTNPEQDVILKCINPEKITPEEEEVLKDAVTFYKEAFPALKAINLSVLSFEDAENLKKYLEAVFNFNLMVFNNIHFEVVFRISIVKDSFREKGKVRDPKFLRYPDLKIVQDSRLYNRANTCDTTVFYASFLENVALRETKPEKGQTIILSIWKNKTGKPFNSYPITNAKIKNEGIEKANKAFEETKTMNHPLFAEIMDLNLAFLASEFVKECPINNPNRLEYFYSAFFADRILSPLREDDPIADYDFIIYPSVAWKHREENIAMTTTALNNKMLLVQAKEFEVLETYYDQDLPTEVCPAKLRFIREANWFEKDLIIWDE
ncbi:MAG: hypothetical protein H0W73_04910 [Bacteroidetes bacterium]|nr:hypothetical protein [Bacteroidota bacterium]